MVARKNSIRTPEYNGTRTVAGKGMMKKATVTPKSPHK
jgi:hypothetical protein